MPPSEAWRTALDQVLDARVIVAIGTSDAGKTTLVTMLAGELASGGVRVAIVDADVGQSEIGPPTTVGLGRVTGRVGRLSEATLVALHFVGVSSPARDITGVVEGARRMTDRARADGFERVLVDTSGLVAGWPGRLLKQRKIDAIDPDLLLVLERADECEPVARRYEGAQRPRVVRLAAGGHPRSRSQTIRRRHRATALDRYLADAGLLSLDLARLVVRTPPNVPLQACAGALCGLDDRGGDTLALGVVEAIDGGVARVRTPLPEAAAVSGLRIGRERSDGTPVPIG